MPVENSRRLDSVLIILAGVFWGSMGLFVRRLNTYGFTSFQVVAIRVTLAALCFSCLLLIRDPKGFCISLRDIPLFLGLGVACSKDPDRQAIPLRHQWNECRSGC